MDEPKLLTEAEARKLRNLTRDEYVAELRERGLIAPEPVDPDLLEAREIAARVFSEDKSDWHAQKVREGKGDDYTPVVAALAGVKRGKELAQPKPLTREMVEEALSMATLDHLLSPKGIDHPDAFNMRAKRLHAALMEQMK